VEFDKLNRPVSAMFVASFLHEEILLKHKRKLRKDIQTNFLKAVIGLYRIKIKFGKSSIKILKLKLQLMCNAFSQ